MNRTKKERRRDFIDGIITGLLVLAVMGCVALLLCGMAGEAMEHPAEQPITYEEHMERFGGVSE